LYIFIVEIDCGTPEAVQGKNYTTTSTKLGSNFTFSCDDGYQVSGWSLDNDYVVRCKNDRLWSFGNLTCIGKKYIIIIHIKYCF